MRVLSSIAAYAATVPRVPSADFAGEWLEATSKMAGPKAKLPKTTTTGVRLAFCWYGSESP